MTAADPLQDPLAFSRRAVGRSAQVPLSLDEIHAQITRAAKLPLSEATTLPAQAYTSDEFFEWELARIFRREWQCVAHVSQIPKPGDFLNLELLGEPLIVIHGKDDAIRVLSRVCPHRAMDIMPVGFGYDGHTLAETREGGPNCGHTRLLLCPYHAWTFELDGKLKACPEMQEAREFRRDEFALKPFKTELWNGFVFVNFDPDAAPLAPGLSEMDADLAPFRMGAMKLTVAREWDCEFNWKVLIENFMESYHHLGIHHKTLQPLMPAKTTWTEQERRHYIRSHLPYKAAANGAPVNPEPATGLQTMPGLRPAQMSEWGLFLVPPTFLLATAPDRLIWYRLQPLGPDRMKLLTTTLLAPEATEQGDFATVREQAAATLVEFHLEDMEVCTAVQRGLSASGWQAGRLSHLEMPVWLIQRYLAARIRGVFPTDDSPAAPSQRP